MEAEPGVGGEDPGEQSAVSPGQGPTPAACVRLAPSAGPGNHLPTSTALWVGGRVCVGGEGRSGRHQGNETFNEICKIAHLVDKNNSYHLPV